MTARQVYEGTLIEMNKVQAPSLLLEDFNYLFNKAVYQYINKRYNIYDMNQQTTDDVRVLKATAILPATQATSAYTTATGTNSLYGATYEVILPSDYLHILNCVCDYEVKKTFKCYDAGTHIQFAASRLTADLWSQVIHNFYMRPSYKKPYFYVHNVNTKITNPTNPYSADDNPNGTDITSATTDTTTNATTVTGGLPKTIKIGTKDKENDVTTVEKAAQIRFGNPSTVRMEIRYGKDDTLFKLDRVYVDYLKAPQNIRLTQEQLDTTEDKSQIMEFPDYVCQEIINELVNLVMENSSDPRLQTHIPISTSVANPAQQQAQPNKK